MTDIFVSSLGKYKPRKKKVGGNEIGLTNSSKRPDENHGEVASPEADDLVKVARSGPDKGNCIWENIEIAFLWNGTNNWPLRMDKSVQIILNKS